MATPEAKVKAAIRKVLVSKDVFYYMPVSNGMGQHGVSDFICCLPNGRFMAIEAKAGDKKPTALQTRFLDAVKSHNGGAVVINETNLAGLEAIIIANMKGR